MDGAAAIDRGPAEPGRLTAAGAEPEGPPARIDNHRRACAVEGINAGNNAMSFLKRLMGRADTPTPQRVRICVECGMPIAEHKDWCSILRAQKDMTARQAPQLDQA